MDFLILHPIDGGMAKVPLVFSFHMDVNSDDDFKRHHNSLICVEGDALVTKCSPLATVHIWYEDLLEGNYTARAYMTDDAGATRYLETQPVSFSIGSAEAVETYNSRLVEKSRQDQHFPEDVNILQWAQQQENSHATSESHADSASARFESFESVFSSARSNPDDLVLVVGVKTAVLTNFPRRQAIRETWANKATLPHDVKVFFLGCTPQLDGFKAHDQRRFQHAVDLEKEVYGDLLTEELDCTDSYKSLSDKVKAFHHFGAAEFPQAKFMMLTDDDVYLRVDELVVNLRQDARPLRKYIGEVGDTGLFPFALTPTRDPTHRYFVPKDQYPMSQLWPFAGGPHYVMSMDCTRFIAKNYWRLRSVNGVEDVTTGLWLMATQVRVEPTSTFAILRAPRCKNDVISVAEFSPVGIRSIHANLLQNRNVCRGYDQIVWQWQETVSVWGMLALLEAKSRREPIQLQIEAYTYDIDHSEAVGVTTIISTPTQAGIKVSCLPSSETLSDYSSRVCTQIHLHFPNEVDSPSSCREVAMMLRAHFQRRYQRMEEHRAINNSWLELWRVNLFSTNSEQLHS
ncbi:hypothetical protein BBJ28_00018848 [Nothophytophthora sp. Chile5]|nr:hypothetical protein BBJ28_00018848 [Nothophytophthora sp. Chile5]